MDNQAFEMHGERVERSSSRGQEWPRKEEGRGRWSLLKVFLVCLLACVITTTLGVLVLSLVSGRRPRYGSETGGEDHGGAPSAPEESKVDLKFQFLNHLSKSKVFRYPGGEVQWARFREDLEDYGSSEEVEFGRSLHHHRSKMTFGTLRIKSRGLRAPHWHFNANEHGFVQQGKAWVGVLGADDTVVTTYNVTAGQVVFFPRNTVHWIQNVGPEDCVLLLFFTTHQELQTLDVDDAFFSTPEDILARALKPRGGVNFIRTFKRSQEDQAVNLPPNLEELLSKATFEQSPAHLVWRFFYDLQGSKEFPFQGGLFQWARFRLNGSGLNELERIFSESLHQHEDTLTLATLRIFSDALGQPHFHSNANEMGFVLSGCGQAGVVLSGVASTFDIGIGDVVFFPVGTQHYLRSFCQEDLLLLLAYSTGDQLETLPMRSYFQGTADHVLAQLFSKAQEDFQNFPRATNK